MRGEEFNPTTLVINYESHARELFEQTGNPVFVWYELYYLLSKPRRPLPDWVLDYLEACTDRMFGVAEPPKDLRAALPDIFGFPASAGRGSAFTPLLSMVRNEKLAMSFAAAILQGKGIKEARSEAANTVDERNVTDDKTLREILAKYFEVEESPNDRDEWRKIIVKWLIKHPQFQFDYPEMPSIVSLIRSNKDLFPEVTRVVFRDPAMKKL